MVGSDVFSGEYQCDKCGFVTNNASMLCFNDGSVLRAVTWRAAAQEARKLFRAKADECDRLQKELEQLNAELVRLREAARRSE